MRNGTGSIAATEKKKQRTARFPEGFSPAVAALSCPRGASSSRKKTKCFRRSVVSRGQAGKNSQKKKENVFSPSRRGPVVEKNSPLAAGCNAPEDFQYFREKAAADGRSPCAFKRTTSFTKLRERVTFPSRKKGGKRRAEARSTAFTRERTTPIGRWHKEEDVHLPEKRGSGIWKETTSFLVCVGELR